jgi:citrate synthase
MDECRPTLNTGLRGITIADTRICDVDGDAGKLIYRGYLIQDLAENTTYEEVVYLLLFEKLPSPPELDDFRRKIASERALPPQLLEALKTQPKDALPMDIIQAAVSLLANYDPELTDHSIEATTRKGIRLIAKTASIVAAWDRIRNGLEPISSREDLSHAADFLYMLTGEIPDAEMARFFDVCLILHAEHSFNASTFAAREVASTQAHLYAAASAAVGSLSGDLHGGANVRVMRMLLEIGSPDKVKAYVDQEFDAGRKIMGLGHAVYKTDDPRGEILAKMSKRMGERTGQTQWYEMSKLLEKTAKKEFLARKDREIYVNVDFYSASLYYTMDIPVDLFSPLFAISRVAGWTAHILEEKYAGAAPKPMLYRPESDYVGDYCGPDTCTFVPLDER